MKRTRGNRIATKADVIASVGITTMILNAKDWQLYLGAALVLLVFTHEFFNPEE